jgi:catechol 2,3-dioxygenase-like lactoylglutathione lyase family enzyme
VAAGRGPARRARLLRVDRPVRRLRIGSDEPDRVQFVGGGASFSFVAGKPTEHVHLAFPAPDDATVDAFHRTATAAGHPDNGPPGERPHYHPGYYGAFVLDPAGHNVEVVCHHRPVK